MTFKTSLAVFALCLLPLQTSAEVIINNATLGLYNSGLGDLQAMDGPGGFSCPARTSAKAIPRVCWVPIPTSPSPPPSAPTGSGGNYSGGTWSAVPVAIPAGWTINTETAIV